MMKFKLVENLDEVLESRQADSMQETTLTEKMWVKVQSNAPSSEPFYFYSTDNHYQKDVNTLINIIKNKQVGTYKQQLDQDILNTLKNEYAECINKGLRFQLKVQDRNVAIQELDPNSARIITLADRELRRIAQDEILRAYGINEAKWMIHHKKGHEHDNTPSGIALIERQGLNDCLSKAVHTLIQQQGIAIQTGSATVEVREFDGSAFVPAYYIDITIR